jgi:hypothetical protein
VTRPLLSCWIDAALEAGPNATTCGRRTASSLFHLSKIMGTSTAMISDVYGHLLPDSEGYLRGLLDAFDDVRGLSAGLMGRA